MSYIKFLIAAGVAAILAACGGDSSSGSERENTESVKDKSISGVSQKGPFVTGTTVKLYELDGKTCAQTGKSFTGKITTDDGKFSVSSVTLASQYALLEANGYFRNEITGNKSKGPITLYALTDISDRENVNINLLTHLEYERAMYLVSTGVDLPSAKKQAESEILTAFGINGEFASSEDLDIFSGSEGDAALLALSVLMLGGLEDKKGETEGPDNVAELTSSLTKFAVDIEKDGVWDDEEYKAKIADWVSWKDNMGGLDLIRSSIEAWNLGLVPDFEKYVRNFWYINDGLGEFGNEGELRTGHVTEKKYKFDGAQKKWLFATMNDTTLELMGCTTNRIGEISTSPTNGLSYVCKNMYDMDWWIAQEIDYDTYGEKCTSKEVGNRMDGVLTETNKYYCTVNGWIGLSGGWNWDVPKDARLNPEITYGSMTDNRDGQTYKTVKIGEQVWMAQNLNYNVGDHSWYFGEYNLNFNIENAAEGGLLYTWTAAIDSFALYGDYGIECGCSRICALPPKVQGACPQGWHLPTLAEWNTLFTEVGEISTAGKVLKSQTGWYANGNGTDAVGFSAIPVGGGAEDKFGYFENGNNAYFWSASNDRSVNGLPGAYFVDLRYDHDDVRLFLEYNSKGFSVRCLKD